MQCMDGAGWRDIMVGGAETVIEARHRNRVTVTNFRHTVANIRLSPLIHPCRYAKGSTAETTTIVAEEAHDKKATAPIAIDEAIHRWKKRWYNRFTAQLQY